MKAPFAQLFVGTTKQGSKQLPPFDRDWSKGPNLATFHISTPNEATFNCQHFPSKILTTKLRRSTLYQSI